LSKTYKTGDIIEVRVEKIVPRGLGLGFAENLTIMTPLTAAGDLLRVRIVDLKKRFAFAEIVEVLENGPHRVDPRCPYFGRCGGCDFQQMSYEAQLDAKVGIIKDCLSRIGKIDKPDIGVIPSPRPYAYRSRARWHLDPAKRTIGYFRRDSHDVIDIDICPILTPSMQSALDYTRENIGWENIWSNKTQVEAAAGEDGAISISSDELVEPTTELSHSAAGETFIYSARSFFQANQYLIPDLINEAIGDFAGETAFDLYSGVGLFTLPLARRFEKVVSVEESPNATEFARRNIENARLTNVDFVQSSVAAYLRDNLDTRVDLLLLDPPRSGTEKWTIPSIIKLRPQNISYVSCEPSILARDLKVLLEAGYTLGKVTAIDLFPQTHHVETIAQLSLG
jgi:23S rRNA (uracil1939-C5)-methyltransferase